MVGAGVREAVGSGVLVGRAVGVEVRRAGVEVGGSDVMVGGAVDRAGRELGGMSVEVGGTVASFAAISVEMGGAVAWLAAASVAVGGSVAVIEAPEAPLAGASVEVGEIEVALGRAGLGVRGTEVGGAVGRGGVGATVGAEVGVAGMTTGAVVVAALVAAFGAAVLVGAEAWPELGLREGGAGGLAVAEAVWAGGSVCAASGSSLIRARTTSRTPAGRSRAACGVRQTFRWIERMISLIGFLLRPYSSPTGGQLGSDRGAAASHQ